MLKTPTQNLLNLVADVVFGVEKRVDDGLGGLATTFYISASARVAEVAREHGWQPPKSLDSDENFKPEHTLFCCKLRFVVIYALFGDLWAKKCLFGSKTVFLGQ